MENCRLGSDQNVLFKHIMKNALILQRYYRKVGMFLALQVKMVDLFTPNKWTYSVLMLILILLLVYSGNGEWLYKIFEGHLFEVFWLTFLVLINFTILYFYQKYNTIFISFPWCGYKFHIRVYLSILHSFNDVSLYSHHQNTISWCNFSTQRFQHVICI